MGKAGAPDMSEQPINIMLRMSDNSTTEAFTTAPSAQLLHILDQYSSHVGHNIHALFFRFDGQLILPYMTPAELGMEDEDIIDVYVSRPSETGKRPLDEGEDQEADRKRGM